MSHLVEYIKLINDSLSENTFVKLSLSNYKGATEGLKNCYVKKIRIKNEDKLSFTYRYQTRDIVKNYSEPEGVAMMGELMGMEGFRNATAFTTVADSALEFMPNGKIVLRKNKPTQTQLPSLEHNTAKNRLIPAGGKSYLHHLKITDEKGEVYKNAQDKYKQINHYVELLNPLIKSMPPHETLKVTDMGAGKGYLTFALYDYLTNEMKQQTSVTGVEYRKDLVDLCNGIAKQSDFSGLKFAQGTINDFDSTGTDVLIALHACDTATDDAIQKGITAGADLIVVAPCCHKQIRREIEKHKTTNELDFLLKHGIFMERQAEMVTDGIRSLIMEYFGYTTKVFQFVSDVHTPKNVMITGEKKSKTDVQKTEILEKIKATKKFFGIESHYLETLMGI
ncbi:MAG: SAM-dependent methyltransferase [Bacteroidota bacterium]